MRFAGPAVAAATALSSVKFALPAVVEQPERGVAALLDFREHDAGADRVDSPGGNEDDVASVTGRQCTMFGDRAVLDRGSQFGGGSCALIQSDRDPGAWRGRENIPCLGLAVARPIDRAKASSG